MVTAKGMERAIMAIHELSKVFFYRTYPAYIIGFRFQRIKKQLWCISLRIDKNNAFKRQKQALYISNLLYFNNFYRLLHKVCIVKVKIFYQNGESIDPFKLLLQDSILSESIFKFRPKFKAILRGSRSWSLPIGQEHQIWYFS